MAKVTARQQVGVHLQISRTSALLIISWMLGAVVVQRLRLWVTNQEVESSNPSTSKLLLLSHCARPLTTNCYMVLYHCWPCALTLIPSNLGSPKERFRNKKTIWCYRKEIILYSHYPVALRWEWGFNLSLAPIKLSFYIVSGSFSRHPRLWVFHWG